MRKAIVEALGRTLQVQRWRFRGVCRADGVVPSAWSRDWLAPVPSCFSGFCFAQCQGQSRPILPMQRVTLARDRSSNPLEEVLSYAMVLVFYFIVLMMFQNFYRHGSMRLRLVIATLLVLGPACAVVGAAKVADVEQCQSSVGSADPAQQSS